MARVPSWIAIESIVEEETVNPILLEEPSNTVEHSMLETAPLERDIEMLHDDGETLQDDMNNVDALKEAVVSASEITDAATDVIVVATESFCGKWGVGKCGIGTEAYGLKGNSRKAAVMVALESASISLWQRFKDFISRIVNKMKDLWRKLFGRGKKISEQGKKYESAVKKADQKMFTGEPITVYPKDNNVDNVKKSAEASMDKFKEGMDDITDAAEEILNIFKEKMQERKKVYDDHNNYKMQTLEGLSILNAAKNTPTLFKHIGNISNLYIKELERLTSNFDEHAHVDSLVTEDKIKAELDQTKKFYSGIIINEQIVNFAEANKPKGDDVKDVTYYQIGGSMVYFKTMTAKENTISYVSIDVINIDKKLLEAPITFKLDASILKPAAEELIAVGNYYDKGVTEAARTTAQLDKISSNFKSMDAAIAKLGANEAENPALEYVKQVMLPYVNSVTKLQRLYTSECELLRSKLTSILEIAEVF